MNDDGSSSRVRQAHGHGEQSVKPQDHNMGRMLVGIGVLIVLIGGIHLLLERIPGFGRLPGDIIIERKNFAFYFPLTTCILVSIILSFFLWLFRR